MSATEGEEQGRVGLSRSAPAPAPCRSQLARSGDQVPHGRLEAAEAEVEPRRVVEQRAREAVALRIAVAGGPFDRRPAGIRQAEQAGDFVERFAGRVVDRAAQRREIGRAFAAVQVRVPAADDQADAGKHVAAARQPAGVDVGLQVIHGQQRQVAGDAQRLGRGQPDQQRPGQARRVGHGDRVEVGERDVRLCEAPRRSPAGSARRGPARRSPARRRRTARAAGPAKRRPTTAPRAGR